MCELLWRSHVTRKVIFFPSGSVTTTIFQLSHFIQGYKGESFDIFMSLERIYLKPSEFMLRKTICIFAEWTAGRLHTRNDAFRTWISGDPNSLHSHPSKLVV
jgi:hypothetical protein